MRNLGCQVQPCPETPRRIYEQHISVQRQKLLWVPLDPQYGSRPEDCPTHKKGALGIPSPEGPALAEILQHRPGVKHALATPVTVDLLAFLEGPRLVHNRGHLGSLVTNKRRKK